MTVQFTDQQIINFRAVADIRESGLYNMMSRNAVEASGLNRDDYFFTLQNFADLKTASDAQGE